MSDDVSVNKVMNTLRQWTDERVNSPSLLVSIDDGSFHLGHYVGMGSSDSASIDKYSPLYKSAIEQLFREGQLQASGRVFTLYPGSDRFKRLIFRK